VPANAKTKLGENKTKWKEDRLLISVNTSSNNTNNQESLGKEGELSASIKTLSRYIKNI
jgi:hypothetical protein